jgi:hypothetical protein
MDPCNHLIACAKSGEPENNLHHDQQDQSNGEALERPERRLQSLSHHQCNYCEGEDRKSSDDVRQSRDEAERQKSSKRDL